MKKLLLAGVIVLMTATSSSAGVCTGFSCNDVDVDVTENVYNTTEEFNTYVNEETTINEAKKRKFEVGIGADVTLYEDKSAKAIVDKVTEEYRYDWANGEHQAYTVVHVNLFQKIKAFFSKG